MFIIKCSYCGWCENTTGFARDLAHLKEIRTGCDKCGKPRKFACPKCKRLAKMTRIHESS